MIVSGREQRRVCWGVAIKLADFPELLAQFRRKEPDTAAIERQGELLAQRAFPASDVQKFIWSVCKWGGYSGVAGRVIKNNARPLLVSCFRDAYAESMSENDGHALVNLLKLRGLAVSFASKHLKFLAPDRAVVLDSIISARLGYATSLDGYKEFLADCHGIRDEIVAARLPYTGWGANGWRVSDIEMAIFEKLRS